MKKHRIGLIGCGWIARFYARILPDLQDRAEVVWAADPEPAQAEAIALLTGPDHSTSTAKGSTKSMRLAYWYPTTCTTKLRSTAWPQVATSSSKNQSLAHWKKPTPLSPVQPGHNAP